MTLVHVYINLNGALERDAVAGLCRAAALRGWRLALSCWGEVEVTSDRPDVIILRQIPEGFQAPDGVPVVHLGGASSRGPNRLWIKDHLIGRQVAEHLLAKGYRNLAYRGDDRFEVSRRRRDGFAEVCHEAGVRFHDLSRAIDAPEAWGIDWEFTDGIRALRSLDLPLGVMTFTAHVGRRLIAACREADLSVPSRVAIVAGEDDAIVAEATTPPLSGVRLGAERLGSAAIELAANLLAGGEHRQPLYFDPLGVSERASSAQHAVDDPALARALAFIEQHACDGAGVDEVAAAAGLPRRRLEMRFRETLARSPGQELRRIRLERAQRLLIDTELAVADIARSCGAASATRFSADFRTVTGLPPAEWRRIRRLGANG